MRDVVFLFGAGASYGAGAIVPERPPLGSSLYSELARIYPRSWGALPLEIEANFVENFEKGMATIHSHIGPAIPQLMRELAIYFIQFRPASSDCLYRKLVRDLKSAGLAKRVTFSTLNYECALEFSITAEQSSIAYFEQDPVENWPVWKLHGSCNYFSQNLQAGPGVLYGTDVTFEGGIQALPNIESVVRHCLVETALAPVMNLYMQGKPLAVSPSAIKQIQAWWTEAILGAKTVVIIGVQPNVSDSHLWKPLAETAANMLFIGSENAFAQWKNEYRSGPSHYLGSRFGPSYGSLISALS